MPQPNLEQLEQELRDFFSGVESVKLAYLFGSTVRGEANCLSDIDIAVLFDDTFLQKVAFDPQLINALPFRKPLTFINQFPGEF